MKLFDMMEILEANDYALAGGQAFHVHNINRGHPLFARYKEIAHLIDYDKERLIATAKRLGVRVIKVEREGGHMQHIDLCGNPFVRAKNECGK